jgi:XTP/dITP diphosphohydrolase
VVGTRSAGKVREVQEILAGLPAVELAFPGNAFLPFEPAEDTIEQGTTFAENAVLKARHFADRSGLPTVAEDSGIEVDALGGAPGVRSKRFAGDDAANNRKLLELLAGTPAAHRTARYHCVAAYVARPDAEAVLFHGITEGRILEGAEGSGGFGYDPLFYSFELGQSFGLAAPHAKHQVSHRGRAFRAFKDYLLRKSVY